MTKLTPIEELANNLEMYGESHYDSINDKAYTEYTLTKYQLESFRQAIISDFVSKLDPIAFSYIENKRLDVGVLSITNLDKSYTQFFDLSEWKTK